MGSLFFSGSAFLRPTMPLSYDLAVKDKYGDSSFGTLQADFPISIRVTLIAGKMINPFVGYYGKVGGEWTYLKLKYSIKGENPPFLVNDANKNSGFTPDKVEELPGVHLKAGFLGAGVMLFNKRWLYALEYNSSFIKDEEIRKFKEATPRRRGYVYGGTHHRVMVRMAYMFGG